MPNASRTRALTVVCFLACATALSGCSLAERAAEAGKSAAANVVDEQLSATLGETLEGAGAKGAAGAVAATATAIASLDGTGATGLALKDGLKDLGWQGAETKLLGLYDVELDGLTAQVTGPDSCWEVHASKGDAVFTTRPCRS